MEWLIIPNIIEPQDCAMNGIPCTSLCLDRDCPCHNGYVCINKSCSPYGGSCIINYG